MGICCAPDMCQEIRENIFTDIPETECFIDNIGAYGESWKEHLKVLRKVLTKLQDNVFTVNPLKCEWTVKETDWLGYWLTPIGLKPWKKKTKGIINMQRPQNVKQLRSFLGAVNYYRDLWPRRSHLVVGCICVDFKREIVVWIFL